METPTNRPAELPPVDVQVLERSVPAAIQSIHPGRLAEVHKPKPLPTRSPQQAPVIPQVSPRTEQNPAAQKTEPTTNTAVELPAAAAPSGGRATSGEGLPAVGGNTSTSSGTQAASNDGKSSGRGNLSESSGARAIVRPMPQIPDDMREDAFNSVALARFHIAVDGSATVELAKPTPNPRLNRILLDSLRKWRFIPAIKNGKPVASTEEIIVKIEVK
jgi:protein TonB